MTFPGPWGEAPLDISQYDEAGAAPRPPVMQNNTITNSAGIAAMVSAQNLDLNLLSGNIGTNNANNVLAISGALSTNATLSSPDLPFAITNTRPSEPPEAAPTSGVCRSKPVSP
jgi:hypothetical protein